MTMDLAGTVALAAGAGMLGGAMNALAGGGSFATLPALIAIGLPANVANATSNVALLPGAGMSAWAFRDELAPIGGVRVRTLAAITFAGGLVGAVLLAITPSSAFDHIIPWLLLFAAVILAWGPAAALWLKSRVVIAPPVLMLAQALLGIYGGYFGGGVGLMTTAIYGLLANISPRALFAPRTLMLATANGAATLVFVAGGLVDWRACVPMLTGGLVGGWLGAHLGKRLPPRPVRIWTLLVTVVTTAVFFHRAYG
jgi:uncharacterized membrane protein YfcA